MIRAIASRHSGEMKFLLVSSITPVVSLLVSMVVTRFVLPVEMGIVQSVFLLLPYAGLLQLGVFSGLNRNLAYYLGRGHPDVAQCMVDASGGYARWLSLVGALIGFIFFIVNLCLHTGQFLYLLACASLMISLLLLPQVQHIETTICSGHQFARLANIRLGETAAFAFASLFPWMLAGLGKVMQDTLRVVVSFVLRWRLQPYPVRGPVKGAALKELIQVGFPIALTGYLWTILSVTDQSVIALTMGAESLGHYSLARLAAALLLVAPQTLGTILYPKASAIFGRTGLPSSLRKHLWASIGITAVLVVPICALGWLWAEPATLRLFPKYAQGVPSARIAFIGGLACIFQAPGIVVNVLRRNGPLFVAILTTVAAMWALGLWIAQRGGGLEDVARLRVGCMFALGTFTLLFSLWITRRSAPADSA